MSAPTIATDMTSVALPAAMETAMIIFQVRGIRAGQKVHFVSFIQVLQGAAAGSLELRIRRGSGLGGSIIGDGAVTTISLAIAERKHIGVVQFENATVDDPQYTLSARDTTAATKEASGIIAGVAH